MNTFSILVLLYIVAAFAVGWYFGAAGRRYHYAQGFDAGVAAGQRLEQYRHPWRPKTRIDWVTLSAGQGEEH